MCLILFFLLISNMLSCDKCCSAVSSFCSKPFSGTTFTAIFLHLAPLWLGIIFGVGGLASGECTQLSAWLVVQSLLSLAHIVFALYMFNVMQKPFDPANPKDRNLNARVQEMLCYDIWFAGYILVGIFQVRVCRRAGAWKLPWKLPIASWFCACGACRRTASNADARRLFRVLTVLLDIPPHTPHTPRRPGLLCGALPLASSCGSSWGRCGRVSTPMSRPSATRPASSSLWSSFSRGYSWPSARSCSAARGAVRPRTRASRV